MIYFAQHSDTLLIKVGCTVDLNSRLYAIDRKYGAIKLLGLVPGYFEHESYLHEKFKNDNVRGVLEGREWFNPSANLTGYISKYARMTIPLPIEETKQARRTNSSDIPNEYVPVRDYIFLSGVGKLLHEKYGDEIPTFKQLTELTGINHKALKAWIYGDMRQFSIKAAKAWCSLFDCKFGKVIMTNFCYIKNRDKHIAEMNQAS